MRNGCRSTTTPLGEWRRRLWRGEPVDSVATRCPVRVYIDGGRYIGHILVLVLPKKLVLKLSI